MGCHSVVQHLLAWHAYNSEFNSQHTHTYNTYTNNSNNNNYRKNGILVMKSTHLQKKFTWHVWRKRLTCMEDNCTSRLFKNV